MLYLSLVMGILVGFLVDQWLARAQIKDPKRIIAAVIVTVLVIVFTYFGHLRSF